MNKSKRGQLTLFIIISILIVGILLVLFFYKDSFFKVPNYDERVSFFKSDFLDCFEESYKHALEVSGSQGGLIAYPDFEYYDMQINFIPFYYDKGESFFPELSFIEEEVSGFSEVLVLNCLSRYTRRINQKDILSYDNFSVSVKVYPNEVVFKNDLELVIFSGDVNYLIDFSDSEVIVSSKLMQSYEVSKMIVDMLTKDDLEWLDLSLISKQASEKGLVVNVLNDEVEEEVYLFSIENNLEEYYPSEFYFMARLNLYEINFP